MSDSLEDECGCEENHPRQYYPTTRIFPKHGYVVRETPDDTYAVVKVTMLGVVLGIVAAYTKEKDASEIALKLNDRRHAEVS